MAVTSAADLTVAICTRNRPRLLRRALQSVSAQTEPPGEILVVDNAPGDAVTRTLVQASRSAQPCSVPGSSVVADW